MLHSFVLSSLSAATVSLAALLAVGPVQAAPHDGPGVACVTHIGRTYTSGGWVHSEGSGGCTAAAQYFAHAIRHDIERKVYWGWRGLATNFETDLYPPFQVWLPVSRRACPGRFRGHVEHDITDLFGRTNSRYTNEASC